MVTQDDALAARLRRLRLHGGAREYFHDEVGFNSRLDTLQAAVLLAKLPHLADWSAARARNAARYTKAFTGPSGRVPAAHRPGQRAHLQPVHPPRAAPGRAAGAPQGEAASATRSTIRCRSICSRASRTSAMPRAACPASEAASAQVISLPVYPGAQPRRSSRRSSTPCSGSTRDHRPGPDRPGRAAGGAVRHRRASATSGCRWRSSSPRRASACSASTCSRRWSTASTPAGRTSRT